MTFHSKVVKSDFLAVSVDGVGAGMVNVVTGPVLS